MKLFKLNKIEKLKLLGLCIKAVSGIFGGSLILAEGHPYLALSILSAGAVANETVSYIKEKENAANTLNPTPDVITPQG